VEQSWRIIEPVLQGVDAVVPYDPGSWGPAAADRLLGDVEVWHPPLSADAYRG
jgi:glucose-6-phosphate 1-dehydrogenase